jgi:outer membrane protein
MVVFGCFVAFVVLFADWNILAENRGEKPLKVGIVDLSKALDSYDKKAQFDAELKEFGEAKKDEIRRKGEDLRAKREKIELLLPGSPERKKLEKEFSASEVELKVMIDAADDELEDKYAALLVELYNDIADECSRYAREKKFDLILKKEALELEQLSPEQVKLSILSQKIVYNVPELDITPDIIRRLKQKG